MKSAPRKRAPKVSQFEKSYPYESCKPDSSDIEKMDLPLSPPVIVALPSITAEKMRAISSLARAMERLAIVLDSVNLKVHIENIRIDNAGNPGPAINICYDEPKPTHFPNTEKL